MNIKYRITFNHGCAEGKGKANCLLVWGKVVKGGVWVKTIYWLMSRTIMFAIT